jgi:hypothetical protein
MLNDPHARATTSSSGRSAFLFSGVCGTRGSVHAHVDVDANADADADVDVVDVDADVGVDVDVDVRANGADMRRRAALCGGVRQPLPKRGR